MTRDEELKATIIDNDSVADGAATVEERQASVSSLEPSEGLPKASS